MKKLIIISIVLLFNCTTSWSQNERLTYIKNTDNGKTLPDFKLLNANGEETSFHKIKANLIVIDIWATWCGPCKRQAPAYDALREEFDEKEVMFLSISRDEIQKTWMSYLKKKKKKNDWHYWVGKDIEHPIEQLTYYQFEKEGVKYTAQGVPRYILVDANYKIIERNLPKPDIGLKERIKKELLNSK
ncbi:MAG: hypothetical protein COA97_12175 [Flavobacteriales bacterium]|nr:MAG: hypothetical protein COA97_12175 [Flavobacteriales bacterium]